MGSGIQGLRMSANDPDPKMVEHHASGYLLMKLLSKIKTLQY